MILFTKILKQAFNITKENKFLWFYGLFLIFENIVLGLVEIVDLPEPRGFLLLASAAGMIILWIMYFRVKAATIIAVKAIAEKQPVSFSKSFKSSEAFLFRIFGIVLLVEAGLTILFLILGSPINYLFERNQTFQAVSLLIPGLIIFIPVAILGLFIEILGSLFVVIYNLKIKEAINRSFEMVMKQWRVLIMFGFLMFITGASTLFLGIFMIGLLSEVSVLAAIFASVAFVILQSVIAVFQQSVWVLAFLDLVQPQKLEEVEPAVVPEIAS